MVDKNCDTMVLGDLIKKLKSKALYPIPVSTPPQLSVAALVAEIQTIQITSLCQFRNPYKTVAAACTITTALHQEVSRIGSNVCGLELKDLVPTHKYPLNFSLFHPNRSRKNESLLMEVSNPRSS